MEINITDAEKDELKKRILENVERRLTEELVQSMSRSVIRDGLSRFQTKVMDMLSVIIEQKINIDFVQRHFNLVVEDYVNPARRDSRMQDQLDKAVLKIVNKLGETIGEEFKFLIYTRLKQELPKEKTE